MSCLVICSKPFRSFFDPPRPAWKPYPPICFCLKSLKGTTDMSCISWRTESWRIHQKCKLMSHQASWKVSEFEFVLFFLVMYRGGGCDSVLFGILNLYRNSESDLRRTVDIWMDFSCFGVSCGTVCSLSVGWGTSSLVPVLVRCSFGGSSRLQSLLGLRSTVGYGDLAPTRPASRLFTLFFIIYGIVVPWWHQSGRCNTYSSRPFGQRGAVCLAGFSISHGHGPCSDQLSKGRGGTLPLKGSLPQLRFEKFICCRIPESQSCMSIYWDSANNYEEQMDRTCYDRSCHFAADIVIFGTGFDLPMRQRRWATFLVAADLGLKGWHWGRIGRAFLFSHSRLCETKRCKQLTQLCNPTATKPKNNLPPHSEHGQKTHWQGQNDGGQDEKHGKREGKRQ